MHRNPGRLPKEVFGDLRRRPLASSHPFWRPGPWVAAARACFKGRSTEIVTVPFCFKRPSFFLKGPSICTSISISEAMRESLDDFPGALGAAGILALGNHRWPCEYLSCLRPWNFRHMACSIGRRFCGVPDAFGAWRAFHLPQTQRFSEVHRPWPARRGQPHNFVGFRPQVHPRNHLPRTPPRQ